MPSSRMIHIYLSLILQSQKAKAVEDILKRERPESHFLLSYLKPGFELKIVSNGWSGFPKEHGWRLQLQDSNKHKAIVKNLKAFKGAVNIRTEQDALRFCRLWTDELFWYCEPRAMEVKFWNAEYPDGYFAHVHSRKWEALVKSYPKVRKIRGRFVVSRLLAIERNYNAFVYKTTETVEENGLYTLSTKRFKSGKDFASIQWYLPTLE